MHPILAAGLPDKVDGVLFGLVPPKNRSDVQAVVFASLSREPGILLLLSHITTQLAVLPVLFLARQRTVGC